MLSRQWKCIRQFQLVRCAASPAKAARTRRTISQTPEANLLGNLPSVGFRAELYPEFHVGFQFRWALCDVRGISKGLADTI